MLTRRNLLAATVALTAGKLPETTPRERPWAKRAVELEDREGAYCDYAAWEEWLASEMGRVFNDDSQADSVLHDDIYSAIALYSTMCRLFD